MLFAYKCSNGSECGAVGEATFPIGQAVEAVVCPECGRDAPRWYSGERKQLMLGELKKELHSGINESLILPNAKMYESEHDPDGSKGLSKWMSEHEPAAGNKRPQWPSLPAGTKKTFAMSSGKKEK